MSDIKKLNDYKLDSNQRTKLIDSLLNIRLSLNVKKIIGDKIKKVELKSLIEEQITKLEDEKVKIEIDKLFDDYFAMENNINNDELSIDEMSQIIENKTNDGNSLVKEFKPKKNMDDVA